MERVSRIAAGATAIPNSSSTTPAPSIRNSKKAIRGWRVVMDKIVTRLLFFEAQKVVQEWFPDLQHASAGHALLPKQEEEETLQDVFAAIITAATPLSALKGKNSPSTSASTCVRPKHGLKGGGAKSQSYVYCQMRRARWENLLTATEIQKMLREKKKGPTSQKSEKKVKKAPSPQGSQDEAIEEEVKGFLGQLKNYLTVEKADQKKAREEMWKEIEQQKAQLKEKTRQYEVALMALQIYRKRIPGRTDASTQSSEPKSDEEDLSLRSSGRASDCEEGRTSVLNMCAKGMPVLRMEAPREQSFSIQSDELPSDRGTTGISLQSAKSTKIQESEDYEKSFARSGFSAVAGQRLRGEKREEEDEEMMEAENFSAGVD